MSRVNASSAPNRNSRIGWMPGGAPTIHSITPLALPRPRCTARSPTSVRYSAATASRVTACVRMSSARCTADGCASSSRVRRMPAPSAAAVAGSRIDALHASGTSSPASSARPSVNSQWIIGVPL
ncbi:MAG: hypothetical protein ACUVS2_06750 [Candidatus Flexifilum sp.]